MKFRNLSNGIPGAPDQWIQWIQWKHSNGANSSSCLLWRAAFSRPYTRPYHDFQPSSNHLSTIFQLPPINFHHLLTLRLRSQITARQQLPCRMALRLCCLRWSKKNGTSILTKLPQNTEVYPRYHFQRFLKYNVDLVCEGRWAKPVQNREGFMPLHWY